MNPVASASILEWFQKPAAIRFTGVYDRTYISWITNDGKIQIRFYDHKIKNFSDISTVDDLYPDFGIEARDDHNAPSLLVLPDGQILIFYSVHDSNNAFFMKRSTDTENISAWSERINIADENTHTPYNYPQAKRLENGNIILFYRRGNFYNSDEYIKISTDNALTWEKSTLLIDFGEDGVYALVAAKENQLHVAWNKSVFDPPRKDIYYMYSRDGGETWSKRDGTPIMLPVTEQTADVVFETKNDGTYVWDIVADDKLNPFIVFAFKHDPHHEFRYAKWDGTVWITNIITSSAQLYRNGNFYSGGIVIDPKNVYSVFLSKKRGNLEVESWGSVDEGVTWKKTESITQNSVVDNFRIQMVENYAADLRLVWSSGIYEGLIDRQWTGYAKVNIQSELTKNSIPTINCND